MWGQKTGVPLLLRETMFKTAKRVIHWTGKYKKRIYLGFVISTFTSLFTSLPIFLSAVILNDLIDDYNGVKKLDSNYLLIAILFMSLPVLMRYILTYLELTIRDSVGYEVTADERLQIGEVLKRISLGKLDKIGSAEISTALTTDLSVLEMQGLQMADKIVNGYIGVITIVLFQSAFNIKMLPISLIGIGLATVFLMILNKKSKETSPINRKAKENMIAATTEYVRGMAVVKSFGKNGAAYDAVMKSYSDSKNINIKIEKNYSIINFFLMMTLKIASAMIVLVAGILILSSEMNMAYGIMMLIFSFVTFDKIENINASAHIMGMIESTLSKLQDLKETKFIDADSKCIPLDSYDIRFKNVSFSYDDKLVINNISFRIPEGTVTAIVGPSGSGKTTIANLIGRFYDVNAGSISIGGVDVRKITTDSLLKNISSVFQKVYLFNDSIKNNIKFGRSDASETEIIAVAKKAHCHDFIMKLPNQYDTVIGEGGASLSGGEKQRISIARAMLKDANIIILDEATASVDPENEHLIQSAITELTRDKTIIIIAHRLATIKNADQILVLDKGEIIQKGKHATLYATEGLYQHFVKIRERAEDWNIERPAGKF